jgi:putative restriction endonuclease
MIAGGGVFTHGSVFPLIDAWEAFGEKNGTSTFERLFDSIDSYRRKNNATPARADTQIGCIILQSPFFLSQAEWIPVPKDFHLNLVQGKAYDARIGTGAELFAWATEQFRQIPVRRVAERPNVEMQFEQALVRRRLGQGAFRLVVTDAYDRRCAVTGEKTLPVLEAAHIRPVANGGQHRIDNGILLRSDIHRLFDLGYVTISGAGELRVSAKLRDQWHNGRVYYELERSQIRVPSDSDSRPARERNLSIGLRRFG